jgi:hypothetical protein
MAGLGPVTHAFLPWGVKESARLSPAMIQEEQSAPGEVRRVNLSGTWDYTVFQRVATIDFP